MGNVMAASSPPQPNIAMPPPPPPTSFPASFAKTDPSGKPGGGDQNETQQLQSKETGLDNPGAMEDLHKKCKDVFPVIFEGAKLMVNKGLSNHFQVSHTVNMSSVAPSGYRFGATYVGTKQVSPHEAFPVLLGDIDPSGNLNANIIHQFGSNVRTSFRTQIQNNKFTAAQLTNDYKGSDFTASLTLGNIDIINESGVVVAHYLQSVTKSVALGAELAYQYGPSVPGGEIAVLSAAGRYTGDDYVVSGTLGGAGLHMCYYQKASDQLQLGVELETNFRLQESVASIGYQVDLPKADLCFRGMVDSNWTVGAVMEKKLQPLPFSFALSGTMNHSKNQFRLGCGLIIG
ncbi:mitochondrial import receptor subunit TOM40 homolog 1 [Anabrus simplex]|uniref:mitochondrial import receptor subunit TOM40 homolog 1 n=1 Tax=Anabrus simplex TaxID=316456 RepID=UPI0034DDAD48